MNITKDTDENIKIRSITNSDYDSLISLQREISDLHVKNRPDMFREGHLNFSRERFDDFVSADNSVGLIAEENGEAVGFVFAYIREIKNHPALLDSRVFYVDDLCVRADRKRCGIGTQLMDACRKTAKENACGRMLLDVHAFNEDAIAFYEKLGFEPRKIQMETALE